MERRANKGKESGDPFAARILTAVAAMHAKEKYR